MLFKRYTEKALEAGCDEAGRGCLAGPVVAAAVILPANFENPILNDSKQLSEKQRNILRKIITEGAIAYAVAFIDHEEIDKINILNASILAMHKAISQLTIRPEHLIIDGNRFKQYTDIPHTCIVKGDEKYMSIAAASVLAKTFRDEYMENLHLRFPNYLWNKNKGYPTKTHRLGILEHGISPFHRKTFQLIPAQLKLKF
jgi:ribonuclease HII